MKHEVSHEWVAGRGPEVTETFTYVLPARVSASYVRQLVVPDRETTRPEARVIYNLGGTIVLGDLFPHQPFRADSADTAVELALAWLNERGVEIDP